MVKIGIIGYGYVGKAMAKLFEKNYEVLVYDVTPGIITESARHHLVDKQEINQCDLGVICVPTPRGTDGSCDTSYVETVLGWLNTPHILLKSTVAVGTTDRLMALTGK